MHVKKLHHLLMRTVLIFCACIAPSAGLHAKNVILFLGDGMGISTVTAARIFAGQQKGLDGEEYDLAFDKFDHVALIKTYNTDAQVPDSAGTITAIMSGEKTRIGVVGIGPDAERGDCQSAKANELPSLLELAEEMGLETGIISTARITHATPAGTYAHSADRNWETDAAMPAEALEAGCSDIARQLVDSPHGDGIDVALGGGRAMFFPSTVNDPEYPERQGKRGDNNDLVKAWRDGGKNRHYVWNKAGFANLNVEANAQYLGLFEPSHMQYEADREKDPAGEPSLTEMTEFALDRLAHNDKGYFLLVEAGRIDHGHHASNAYRALLDTVALSDAVEATLAKVDLEETLIIVTADHSHTLTISGYPRRGNPILGKMVPVEELNLPGLKPYTTLSYANGPGHQKQLPDLSEVDTTAPNYRQLGLIPLPSETHAGEDVAAFAQGNGADRVKGVMEQNKLFNVMRQALLNIPEKPEAGDKK